MNRITDKIDSVTDCSYWLKTPTPFPKSVKIEINSNCNYKCTFCATQFNLRNIGGMDRKLFEKIIDELASLNIEEIGLFYLGEPFLCNWLADAICYTKSKGIKYVFLTTNGSMVTEKRIRDCLSAGLDSIKFSLNFADEKQFEDVTKVPFRVYRQIIENIKTTRKVRDELGSKCGIYASCIRYDDEQVEKMQQTLCELKDVIDEFYWLPLYSQAGMFEEQTVVGNVGRHGNQRRGIPCWSIFSSAHITHEGLLTACCFDHTNEFTMGDLKTKSFAECWNSNEFIELRNHHIDGDIRNTKCKNCLLK